MAVVEKPCKGNNNNNNNNKAVDTKNNNGDRTKKKKVNEQQTKTRNETKQGRTTEPDAVWHQSQLERNVLRPFYLVLPSFPRRLYRLKVLLDFVKLQGFTGLYRYFISFPWSYGFHQVPMGFT